MDLFVEKPINRSKLACILDQLQDQLGEPSTDCSSSDALETFLRGRPTGFPRSAVRLIWRLTPRYILRPVLSLCIPQRSQNRDMSCMKT